MSQFSPEQLQQLQQLFGQYINPIQPQRRPVGVTPGRGGGVPYYGRTPEGLYIYDPNDPRLGPPPISARIPTQPEIQAQQATDDDRRYQDILGIHARTQAGATNQLNEQGEYLQGTVREVEGLGNAARRQILSRERTRGGEILSGLTRRGLGSSTILPNAQRAVVNDTNRSLQDLNESVTGMRVGARGRLSDFMGDRTRLETGLSLASTEPRQRRSDMYHQLQLARMAAAANGGGGSGWANILGPVLGLGGTLGAAAILA